jgi:hypothetical protein
MTPTIPATTTAATAVTGMTPSFGVVVVAVAIVVGGVGV